MQSRDKLNPPACSFNEYLARYELSRNFGGFLSHFSHSRLPWRLTRPMTLPCLSPDQLTRLGMVCRIIFDRTLKIWFVSTPCWFHLEPPARNLHQERKAFFTDTLVLDIRWCRDRCCPWTIRGVLCFLGNTTSSNSSLSSDFAEYTPKWQLTGSTPNSPTMSSTRWVPRPRRACANSWQV